MKYLKILLLFSICVFTSFLIKTCHYNRETAHVAMIVRDAPPVWYGRVSRNGTLQSTDIRDAWPNHHRNFLAFTIESAMMYAYSCDVASGKGVPAYDKRLAYLPDVPPYAQMNMMLEWVLGWSWRIRNRFSPAPPPDPEELQYQDDPAFARFVSLQIRIWMSVVSGLVFLWLAVLRTPLRYAFAGGMLHAVSAASIARATGQDIVRGDFCIPLLILAFVTAYSILSKPSRWKYLLLFLAVFASFIAWDLSQLLIVSWCGVELLRWILGGRMTEKRRRIFLMIALAVVLNALFIPFNITYGLIQSQLVCICLPLLLLTAYFFPDPRKIILPQHCPALPPAFRRIALIIVAGCLLWLFHAFVVETPEHRANYSHFSEVMKAKFRFANVKPADPAKLNYDARMMWTPAMHSADWGITDGFFPSLGSLPGFTATSGPVGLRTCWNVVPLTLSTTLLLLLISGLFTPLRESLLRDLPRSLLPFLFTVGFFFGFLLIVRYHEFLIIFLSVFLPLVVHRMSRGLTRYRSGWVRIPLRSLLVSWFTFLLCFECFVSCFARHRDYSGDRYQRERAGLIRWFRQIPAMKDRTILTDFSVGPMLMAYCSARIVLQPQFGMAAIREPVEEYLKILYHGSEEKLAAFCERYHVEFLLLDLGGVGPMHPNSMRYIANSPDILPDSPISRMAYQPDSLRRFIRIPAPPGFRYVARKYMLFRFISPEMMKQADLLMKQAQSAGKQKRPEEARRLAWKALTIDPGNEELRLYYIRLTDSAPEVPGRVLMETFQK